MKHFIAILLMMVASTTCHAQVYQMPTHEGQSIDPARLYLYSKGKASRKTLANSDTDPITKRRLEMRSFIPQGNWMYGIAAGYLGHRSGNTDFAFSGLKHASMYLSGFSINPYMGYAVCNNGILGLRAGYYKSTGEKAHWACYEGELLRYTFRNLDYAEDHYSVEAFYRGYVPVDKSLRFALFAEFTLGYMGGSGRLKSMRDDTAYRSNFSLNQFRLGVRPGMAVALCNNVSLDLSFGLANANITMQHEKNRDGESNKDTKARLTSVVDLTDFQLGITMNY